METGGGETILPVETGGGETIHLVETGGGETILLVETGGGETILPVGTGGAFHPRSNLVVPGVERSLLHCKSTVLKWEE